jgi:hypothetical protein
MSALVWWITFYTNVGGIGGAWECPPHHHRPVRRHPSASLSVRAIFAYRPFPMWIGIALWLAGITLSRRLAAFHLIATTKINKIP